MNYLSLLGAYVLGIVTSYSYDKLRFWFRSKKRDRLFAALKDPKNWTTSDGESYYYENEPEFRIIIDKGQDVLAEKYKKFPDKTNDRLSWVRAMYKEVTIFGWNFMHLDGYRLLVPVPKTEYDVGEKTYDYYDLSSIEIRIFRIIGEANLLGGKSKMEGLKKVADILNITIAEL